MSIFAKELAISFFCSFALSGLWFILPFVSGVGTPACGLYTPSWLEGGSCPCQRWQSRLDLYTPSGLEGGSCPCQRWQSCLCLYTLSGLEGGSCSCQRWQSCLCPVGLFVVGRRFMFVPGVAIPPVSCWPFCGRRVVHIHVRDSTPPVNCTSFQAYGLCCNLCRA